MFEEISKNQFLKVIREKGKTIPEQKLIKLIRRHKCLNSLIEQSLLNKTNLTPDNYLILLSEYDDYYKKEYFNGARSWSYEPEIYELSEYSNNALINFFKTFTDKELLKQTLYEKIYLKSYKDMFEIFNNVLDNPLELLEYIGTNATMYIFR